MDTFSALARGMASQGNEAMVFDWVKAARIIRESNASSAGAGLAGDWEWTGGEILRDGKPVPRNESHPYLASKWATPELEIDGMRQDCYRMQSEVPDWGSDTYWPDEALEILNAA